MIKLGQWQKLSILKKESFGVYLGDEEEKVLLPAKQVPENVKTGDKINVFVYRDSDDRLIATVREPKVTLNEVAVLEVKEVTPIGAFLDWGLEKDLLLPYREQKVKAVNGEFVIVALYIDKSDRLAATTYVEHYIKGDLEAKKKQMSLLKMKADSENVYRLIKKKGNHLEYDDKADPATIEKDFGMSKNAFKKAVGILYKAGRVDLRNGKIFLF